MAMREIEKTKTMQQQLIFHAVQNGDFLRLLLQPSLLHLLPSATTATFYLAMEEKVFPPLCVVLHCFSFAETKMHWAVAPHQALD